MAKYLKSLGLPEDKITAILQKTTNLNEIFEYGNTPDRQEAVVWDTKVFEKYRLEAESVDLEVVDGIFSCTRCKSKKIITTSKQTRSGDESTTVFAMCSVCKNKWIVN
jgi:DNA-directed RNA polymerase subunit M/transcription elongation factor TFIIS